MKKIYMLSLIFLIAEGCKTVEKEMYLIPKGFTGRVEIIFDQQKGSVIRYEGKSRVYIIPDSGILLTQFHYIGGWVNHQFFFIDQNGERTEISVVKNDSLFKEYGSNLDKDKINIFSDGTTGQATKQGAQFQFFFVSSYSGFDTIENDTHFSARVNNLIKE